MSQNLLSDDVIKERIDFFARYRYAYKTNPIPVQTIGTLLHTNIHPNDFGIPEDHWKEAIEYADRFYPVATVNPKLTRRKQNELAIPYKLR